MNGVEMRGFEDDGGLETLFETFGVFPDYRAMLPVHLTEVLRQQHPTLTIDSIELLEQPRCRLDGFENPKNGSLVRVHSLHVPLILRLGVDVDGRHYTLNVELVLKADEMHRSPSLSTDLFIREQG